MWSLEIGTMVRLENLINHKAKKEQREIYELIAQRKLSTRGCDMSRDITNSSSKEDIKEGNNMTRIQGCQINSAKYMKK